MGTKFFIYDDGKTVSSSSVSDLKNLCQQAAPASDVITGAYDSNLTGANYGDRCILVVPGGAAMLMGWAIRASRWNVGELVNQQKFGYFGVCAGSYIACDSSYIFSSVDNKPVCFSTTDAANASLRLGSFATGYGPFYPSLSPELKINGHHKYDVHVVTTDSFSLPYQAYINGCAFADIREDMDIIARYSDLTSYTFNFKGAELPHSLTHPACCIRRRISDGMSGILLAGTHLETAVQDSQLLKCMEPTIQTSTYGQRFSLFSQHQAKMLDATMALVQETFSLK